MERCVICDGASTCPKDSPPVLLPEGFPMVIDRGEESLQELSDVLENKGLIITHIKLRYVLAVPANVTIVGTAQRNRIEAHFPVEAVWVGQCSYAFRALTESIR